MPEIKEGWARWLTETERETLRSWATGTRVWKLARTLAASRALVEKKDKALRGCVGRLARLCHSARVLGKV